MLAGNNAAATWRDAPGAAHANVQAKLSLFVGAPFKKPGLFVSTEIVEGAANDEVASARAVCTNMEVVFVRTDIVVAACPKDVAGSIDNRALAGVVWPDENVEAGREL